MPNPIDPSARILSDFAADPEMAELVELFVTELPTRVAALNAAWSGKRLTDLTRLAHQLKGASAGYGFPTIGNAAGALEAGLKKLDAATAQASVERLAREYRELVDLCDRAGQKA
jgi:HPt (histidine-containing phosphotransfer) domain-containing protein